MNSGADIAAPPAVRAGNPAEDQRRDEVLCRLLNTPYRPIDRLSATARGGGPAELPAIEAPVEA